MDIDTVITARGDLTSDGADAVVFSFPEISDGTSGTHDGSTISTSSDGTITTGGGMMGQLSWDGALFAFPDAGSVMVDRHLGANVVIRFDVSVIKWVRQNEYVQYLSQDQPKLRYLLCTKRPVKK